MGTLVRERYGINRTYNIGFSTYTGTVTGITLLLSHYHFYIFSLIICF